MGNSEVKQGGSEPIDMDLQTFKKRSIFNETQDEENLKNHLNEMEKRQAYLRSFKHHEDFDRISCEKDEQISWEHAMENIIKLVPVSSFFISRMYLTYNYGPFYHPKAHFNAFVKVCCFGFVFVLSCLQLSEAYHICNHRFYGQSFADQQKYRALDEKLDFYRYVDKVKYDYSYDNANMREIKKKYLQKREVHDQKEFIRILKERYGEGKTADPNKELDNY